MAKARPLYTVEQQYELLKSNSLDHLSHLSVVKFRLLVACSSGGTLEQSQIRFLNLIQDTEVRTIFASLLEVPEIRDTTGVKSILKIHRSFKQHYPLIHGVLKELGILGVPRYTIDLFDDYFFSNDDPIYKLSIMASAVMMAYIKDDELNNRK